MIRRLSFFVIFLLFLFSACKKEDEFTSVKVTYYVQIADSNSVEISYNSDYFFDSGNRKTISFTSSGGIWVASHIAYQQEDYYIRVDYKDSIGSEHDFQVKVIFDDTKTRDSVAYDRVVTPVELSGTVTN